MVKECFMHPESGFTLVEVLVSVAVSAIALTSLVIAFDIVEKQYTEIRDVSQMSQSGRNILKIIERDIRMAGYVHHIDSGSKQFGEIATPVQFTNLTKCCDEIKVIYDYRNDFDSSTKRIEIRYWVENYTGSGGIRGRLFKQTNIIAPSASSGDKEPMADYIEDLQFEPSGPDAKPNSLIGVYLALRSKKELRRQKLFKRGGHFPGDSTTEKNDQYWREEFSTSVAVRNLTL